MPITRGKRGVLLSTPRFFCVRVFLGRREPSMVVLFVG